MRTRLEDCPLSLSLIFSHFVFCLFVQFMLEMIDESLIVNGMNIVEEVPKVLKVLG